MAKCQLLLSGARSFNLTLDPWGHGQIGGSLPFSSCSCAVRHCLSRRFLVSSEELKAGYWRYTAYTEHELKAKDNVTSATVLRSRVVAYGTPVRPAGRLCQRCNQLHPLQSVPFSLRSFVASAFPHPTGECRDIRRPASALLTRGYAAAPFG